ncbi:MAG: alpha/beta fold hydrolase [Pseudomonadota bacterium]
MLVLGLGAVIAVLSILQLERARSGIAIAYVDLADTPATIYRGEAETDLLVVVSHGFAGSRQMMEAISLTLANAGHVVVAFDYLGHGRHPRALSPDIHNLTGTTEDLVVQTLDVVRAAQKMAGSERVALVGHSMATDVIVRTAARLPEVESVAAISMYSEAVTPDHPARLLIVSGARESRLREVALTTVEQFGKAEEGVTVTRDEGARRAVAAPWVGHVGVLWSSVTSSEIAAWLGPSAEPVRTGPWIAELLAAIVAMFWPIAARLPLGLRHQSASLRRAIAAVLVATAVAALAGLTAVPLLGYAGFGALALFLAIWGAVVLAVLRPRLTLDGPGMLAAVMVLIWGLLVFALALDRYGAAFLPSGPRLALLAALLPAALVFALADRILIHGRGLLWAILLRVPVFGGLLAAMLLNSGGIGMLFTMLPVLVLFLLVYGTMTGWAARRAGPTGPGLASGVILAWAIAASTPLFSA